MVATSACVDASNSVDPAVVDTPPEQAASPARVRANRANARKSTGPQTPEGKARSSQNALVHGLRAASILGPGEDAQELRDYRISIVRATNPRNAVEMEYVEQIVRAGWKLRRYQGAEVECLQKYNRPAMGQRPAAAELNDLLFGYRPFFVYLMRYEQQYVRMMNRAVEELRRLKQDPIYGTLCDFAGEMIDQEAQAPAEPEPDQTSNQPAQAAQNAPNEPNPPSRGLSHGTGTTYGMPPPVDTLVECLKTARQLLGQHPNEDFPPRSAGS